jgi:hypothetical protein
MAITGLENLEIQYVISLSFAFGFGTATGRRLHGNLSFVA